MKVVTRIAPSPTGQMHIGTVRTALFNYLWAKRNGGTFIVRIEDTDAARNRPEWTQMIWDDFEWCGLIPDKKYIQSQHLPRHRELLEKLLAEGKAYISKEPAKNNPEEVVEVVRLHNAGTRVAFDDYIRGEITFDTAELGDFAIARSITEPLYHFAVVVDDADADVTHVIRGEDILSSTPRQILIQEALGLPRPVYVHLPLILSKNGKKLSKRDHAVALEDYRNKGFLPEGVLNYLALLGWNPGTDEEYFSLEQLIQRFSLDGLQKSGAIFDDVKLLSVNQHWMRKLSEEEFKAHLGGNTPLDTELIKLLKERAHTFGEAADLIKTDEFSFASPAILYDAELLLKDEKTDSATAVKHLMNTAEMLTPLSERDFTADRIKETIFPYATEQGRGAVLWPLRVALSGREKSPDPFTIASIIGKEATLRRIETAIRMLKGV
jgi:glutamyl-tRNA synthetase